MDFPSGDDYTLPPAVPIQVPLGPRSLEPLATSPKYHHHPHHYYMATTRRKLIIESTRFFSEIGKQKKILSIEISNIATV